MDLNATTAFIGALSGAFVLVLGKIFDAYMALREARKKDLDAESQRQLNEERQRAQTNIPVNEQAVHILQDIIASLRADSAKLVDLMHEQDKLLIACREEKVALKVTNDQLAKDLEACKKKLTELEGRMAAQEKKL